MDKLNKYQQVANKKGGYLLSKSITNKKLQWKCSEGHVFWLTANKVHRRGQWCKKCGSSIGERSIRNILTSFNISFTQQYQLSQIPRRKYDFYFEYNHKKYIIEFDGEQHFRYVRKYHKTKAGFMKCQIIDRIKTYYAWNSGITIIRIDYTQIDNIQRHIIDGINSGAMVYLSDPQLYQYITSVNISPEHFSQYS